MTSLALLQRRTAIRFAAVRRETLALGTAALVALLALALTAAGSRFDRADAKAAAPSTIAPAAPATLVAATSGEQSLEVRATGSGAEQINAALPFSDAPVQAAAAFRAPAGGTSYERALTCLTQAVYHEAGYEPEAGRRAVAQVILNRMRHPAFPKSVCAVVYQHNATPICQFTFVCDGSLARQPSATAWNEARRIAAAALGGYVEASVGQATHYHADYVAPRWAPLLTKIHKIGAHIFYRWPGSWGTSRAFNGRYIGEPSDPAALRPAARAPVLLADSEAAGEAGLPLAPAHVTFEQDKTVRRAANDVGGLMDPSKRWTLSIPGPDDSASRSRALLAQQAQSPAGATAVAAVTTAASGSAALAAN
jgi:spore germination cell wall hydrolase CwlJ-like protein